MISNNLLSNAQYGFRSKRSCVVQLSEAMEQWTTSLNHGVPADQLKYYSKCQPQTDRMGENPGVHYSAAHWAAANAPAIELYHIYCTN